MKTYRLLFVITVPILFLLISLFNISDYGINWDSPMHYNRGFAYLHYFMTGKEDYSDLPKASLDESVDFKDIRGKYMPLYLQTERTDNPSGKVRSYYESDVFNFKYFKSNDSGHPPLNGIIAASSNYLFYQKLGILSDLNSYKVLPIIIAFTAVLAVAIFVYSLFGIIPSVIASFSFAFYPLFFSEIQFNIKDPVETSFFALTIILFYFGITKSNFKILLTSFIFSGLALGTKFNALFIPVILLPWLIFYRTSTRNSNLLIPDFFKLLSLSIIPLLILFLTWPFLSFNGLSGLLSIFKYYQAEGIGSLPATDAFVFLGFNFFAPFWIIITTPLPILLLSLIGIIWMIKDLTLYKNHTYFLILLWLSVPILRVMIPDTVIYGGVRHIMEYIPALSISAGIGSYYLLKKLSAMKYSVFLLLTLSAIFIIFELVNIHPNENVYFNQLIGGLAGAKNSNVPYWGNSFGNAYKQGLAWLNNNAEKDARLGLPIGGTVNLPREILRNDINLSNDNFSAFAKKGEYEIEMSHDALPKKSFAYSYLDNFLIPVYEVKVDGVAILKVWKNDLNHTKPGFEKEQEYPVENKTQNDAQLTIILPKVIRLTRLYINHNKSECKNTLNGYIEDSVDGNSWEREVDPLSYPQMSLSQISSIDYDFAFLFPSRKSKFIRIKLEDPDSCLFKNPKIKIYGLVN